jgi:cation diffusion facilitator family transporter
MSKENSPSMIAAWVSLISNFLLTGIKIFVGLVFKSQVLVADGVHNAGDVIASAATLSSMHISKRPPDEDHPYGHGKAEVIGAGFVAIILAAASIYIGYNSLKVLFQPIPKAHVIAFIAAIVSLLWKQALYIYTIRIGKQVNSKGLIATAHDHLADVYGSLAAVIGIGLGLIGEHWDIAYLAYGDPIAGFIVALLVMKLAYSMGQESIDVLMEKNIDLEQIREFSVLIQAFPQIKRIDRIRAREHGHYLIVDIRIGIDAKLSIQEGHDISKQIKQVMMQQYPNIEEVLVHLNPWYDKVKPATPLLSTQAIGAEPDITKQKKPIE